MDDSTTRRVAGYELGDELGRGGMGVVFSARHATLDRPAVLKRLRRELVDEPEIVERFLNEACTAASVHHPNVAAVYDCFRREATSIRSGAGPVLVDAHTYRYKGHSMSDPQKYRSQDEIDQYEQQDPIDRLANHLMETNQATQEQIDELDRRAKAVALDAVEYANDAPPTPLEQLYTDVYAHPYGPYPQAEPS